MHIGFGLSVLRCAYLITAALNFWHRQVTAFTFVRCVSLDKHLQVDLDLVTADDSSWGHGASTKHLVVYVCKPVK